jgi:hypothetical protein
MVYGWIITWNFEVRQQASRPSSSLLLPVAHPALGAVSRDEPG